MSAKDMYEKDFYKVLGVTKSATSDEIKKAYRKLAKDLHPDKTQGDNKLEERFKEVSEAYDVLGDAKSRAEYDQARDMFAAGGFRGGPGGFNGNLNDMFGGANQFGDLGDMLGGLFGGGRFGGPRRGADLETTITISFREAIAGVTVPIRGGSQTRIPAGVKDGARIRLKGKGGQGEPGAPAGDLFIIVQVNADTVFGRDGDNLTLTLPISFAEAALGADIKVPVLHGPPVTMRLKPGTQNGAKLRARGKGVLRKDNSHGDLIVTVEVAVPTHIDDELAAAIEVVKHKQPGIELRSKIMQLAGAQHD